jgi:hypothetical protein
LALDLGMAKMATAPSSEKIVYSQTDKWRICPKDWRCLAPAVRQFRVGQWRRKARNDHLRKGVMEPVVSWRVLRDG